MSEIFKVCHLNRDILEKIFIFYGKHEINDGSKKIDLLQLFNLEPENPLFSNIFTEEELLNIKKNKIKLEFLPYKIYIDDTIEDIKKKIILAFEKNISFDEIYLFGMQEEKLNPSKIYQQLTKDDKIDLTKEKLVQFLLNFTSLNIDELDDKPIYDFDDILELDVEKKHIIKKPIGQRFLDDDSKYQYTINPFDVIVYDRVIEDNTTDIISTQNSSLLLNFGNIKFNTIYLTLAEDVFKYTKEKGLDEAFPESTAKLYYPFLFKKDITTLQTLSQNKEELLTKNKGLLNSNFMHKIENIDLFHNIDSVSDPLTYISNGITEMEFNLYPDIAFLMPLDIIFKLVNATDKVPIIKYNPGSRREKIYRLYSEKTSTDGRRIPYLNKASIFKLMKTIGPTNSVALYIETEYSDEKIIMTTTFDNSGKINITCKTLNPLSIEIFSDLIKENINPIIESVKLYIEQSGYNINFFESFNSSNVEIVNMKYSSYLSIKKNITLSKISGCISSVFNILEGSLKNGIVMRFKRVSNFNVMNSQEATIIELINKGLSKQEVINSIMQNFEKSKEDAEKLFLKFLSEVQVERGLYENKKLKIKDNPGFLSSITLDKFQGNITFSIENINNIHYLKVLPVYINALIQITEGTYDKQYKGAVNKLCKKISQKKEVLVEDIIAPTERPDELQKAEEFVFDDDKNEDEDDFLDLLMGDESDMEGGSDSSEIELGDSISSASPSPAASLGESIGEASPSPAASLGESIGEASPSPAASLGESIGEASPSPAASLGESIGEASPSPAASLGESIGEASPSPTSIPAPLSSDNLSQAEESNLDESKKSSSSIDELSSLDIQDVESSIKPGSTIGNTLPESKPIQRSLSPIESDDEEELTRDITGMQLANPNYFFNRMEKRDPVLFLKQKQGEFNAYSRMCPSNVRRQPVILTKAELDKIDREHPGSYDEVIKYGSNPKKQYYYICPRYWCLKNNTSLTQEEVDKGVCGGKDAIIPFGAKKVPKGKAIFEFTDDKVHKDEDGNYIKHYPGFIPGKKHPDGYCMPCCFKSWDAPQQKARRKQCEINEADADTPDSLVRVASNEPEDYIKGNEKFPLDQNRWGFLPISIQKFLHTNNKNCQVSASNTNIKPFHMCLLRHGVEVNKNQSFISCIADLFADEDIWQKKNGKIIPTINEMKTIMKSALTIDNYITLQNGNLIELFYDNTKDVNIDDYQDSLLYKKINTQEEGEVEFLEKVIASFVSFQEFLDRDDVVIDYRYLWDLICKPNDKLFSKGLNLIILEIMEDDNTENIELICPTNNYSKSYFDPRKNSFLLIKKDEYYEPIYSYLDVETHFIVKKTFNEYSKLLPNIKIMLSEIKEYMNTSCITLPSQPSVYKFKENITLNELLKEVKLINGSINYFVLNFNGKVIGIKIKIDGKTGFLPCFPSSVPKEYLESVNFKFINDEDIWDTYENTISFLHNILSKNKNIPSNIRVKVEEDGLIVGFLTETNQFIQISEPTASIDDGIPVIKDENYITANSEIFLNKNVDKKRIEYITKLKMERNFYNVFRNTLRIILNKYENRKLRTEIKNIVEAPYILYYDKLRSVIEKLHVLLDEYVMFYDYKISDLFDIKQVTSCVNSETCDSEWCIREDSGPCKIMLPSKNLLTDKKNDDIYFGKLADELIRFNRIKLFIFEPKTYLSFTEVNYNLMKTEIILLQSLITQDYFENLVPMENNSYIKSLTFDTADPIITQRYSKNIKSKLFRHLESTTCNIKNNAKITGKWSKFLPSKFKELVYSNTPICTFELFKKLIYETSNRVVEVDEIKQSLIDLYKSKIEELGEQNIYNILLNQGKTNEIRQVQHNQLLLEDLIMSEGYYLTNLDLWFLSLKFNVAIILISSTKLLENKKNLLATFYPADSNYVIIRSPGIKPGNIPKYTLITNNDGDVVINSKTLPKSFQQILATSKGITGKGMLLDDFIKGYKPLRYISKKQKRPKLKLQETPSTKSKKLGKKIKLTTGSNE